MLANVLKKMISFTATQKRSLIMKKGTFLNSKIIPLLRKGFFLIKKNAFLGFKKVQFYENKFKPNSFVANRIQKNKIIPLD